MTCRDCKKAEPVYGSIRCEACRAIAEAKAKVRKLAWWRAYYERVRRPKFGHVKRYKTKARDELT